MLSVGQIWTQGLYGVQIICIDPPNFTVKCLTTGSTAIWPVGYIHTFKAKGLSLQECIDFLHQNGWKLSTKQSAFATCNKCQKTFPWLENGLSFLCYDCEINQ